MPTATDPTAADPGAADPTAADPGAADPSTSPARRPHNGRVAAHARDVVALSASVAQAPLPALTLAPSYIAIGTDALLLLADLPCTADLFQEIGELPARAFVDSVRMNGVLQPILVEQVKAPAPGAPLYRIVEGRRRVYAAVLAGMRDVPAKVFPEGELNAHVVSLMMNEQRSANPLSDYLNLCRLEATYRVIGYDDAAISRAISQATGMPRGTIKSRLGIKRLIPALHAALVGQRKGQGHQGADLTIPVQVADEASKLPPELQEGLNAILELRGKLKVSDVRDARRTAGAQASGGLPDSMFGDDDDAATQPNVGAQGGTVAPAIVYRPDPEGTRLLAALLARQVRNMKKNGVDPATVTETREAQAYLDMLAGIDGAGTDMLAGIDGTGTDDSEGEED